MTGDTGIHEQMIGDDKVNGAISALSIVSAELMETIRNAHLALEDCVDGRGGTAALRRAGELLLEEKRTLILPAGSQTERQFVIGGAGRITGRVESVSGPPLAGVEVSLTAIPSAKTRQRFYTTYLQKIADRYWVPTSLPWRSFWVGSWSSQKPLRIRSSEMTSGSYTTIAASACPVRPVHTS